METIRSVIAFAAQHKLIIHQFDVNSAFLNETISKEVYVQQPQGYKKEDTKGLQAPHSLRAKTGTSSLEWSHRHLSHLRGFHPKQQWSFPIHPRKERKDSHYCLYVDDLIVTCEDVETKTKKKMLIQEPTKFLWVISYTWQNTRPDIKFSVALVSLFVSHPKPSHLLADKRTLRYIQGTRNYGILYKHEDNDGISGFSDSDWGEVQATIRKALKALCFFTGSKPMSWSFRKQSTVVLSSIKAEYMALCAATCEISGLREFMKKSRKEWVKTWRSFKSTATINPPYPSQRIMFYVTKANTALKYHCVRDMVEKKIKVDFCPNEEQLAGILTKPFPEQGFRNWGKP